VRVRVCVCVCVCQERTRLHKAELLSAVDSCSRLYGARLLGDCTSLFPVPVNVHHHRAMLVVVGVNNFKLSRIYMQSRGSRIEVLEQEYTSLHFTGSFPIFYINDETVRDMSIWLVPLLDIDIPRNANGGMRKRNQ
jgi:hypothetical protein